MELIISIFLALLSIYFSIGVLFGFYFLFIGAVKIDPLLANSKKIIRVLVLPGVIATWPFFVLKSVHQKHTES